MVFDGILRSWMGETNERLKLFCVNWLAFTMDLSMIGTAVNAPVAVPFASIPPVPSVAIRRTGCCGREEVGMRMFCTGRGTAVDSKEVRWWVAWGTLTVIIWVCSEGEREQDLRWFTTSASAFICTSGGGDDVDEREWQIWKPFSLVVVLTGGEGLTLFMECDETAVAVVIMDGRDLFCSKLIAALLITCVPLDKECWGMTRTTCPAPGIAWITLTGACPLLFIVNGMYGPFTWDLLVAACMMPTGWAPLTVGMMEPWMNVAGLLLACTKLTVPPLALLGADNTGKVTKCPWPLCGSRDISLGAHKFTGLFSLGLGAVGRHNCLGEGGISELGSRGRFRLTAGKDEKQSLKFTL